MVVLGGTAARWLTNDMDVIQQVDMALPVIATFQLFDSLATTLNGALKGVGKQAAGSIISLFCYYVVAMPISFTTAFWLRWELVGLWAGIAVALSL
jgi:multidrug resistance protein, MATE family